MYQLHITNAGPSMAQNVIVTDTLPLSTTLVGVSDFCNGAGGIVTCTLSSLALGESSLAFVQVRISESTPDSMVITNTASVTSATTDPVSGNNVALEETTVVQLALNSTDLEISKTGTLVTVVAGKLITYTIVVTNNGPAPASTVQVIDIIPVGTQFVSVNSSQGLCQTDVVCNLGDLAFGGLAQITLTVRVDPDRLTSVVNLARVSASNPDSNQNNNEDTETTVVETQADLSLSKTATPYPAIPGNTLSYVITIDNNGPSDAQNVVITETLPVRLTGAILSTSDGTCVSNVCDLGVIPAGDQATVNVVGSVDASTLNALVNTVVVTSTTSDSDLSNNTVTITTPVNVVADLSLDKRSTSTAFTGGTIVYTLTVFQQGPSDAQNVVVTDTLPTGVTFTSASAGCVNTGGTVVCTTPILSANTTITYIIRVMVNADVVGGTSLENVATVTADTPDENPANNSDNADTSIIVYSISDLELSKSGPSTASPGQQVTYTIVVTNNGPLFWSELIDIEDVLPLNISLTRASLTRDGSTNSCSASTCQVSDMRVDETVTMTVIASVDPNVISGDVLANMATIKSTTPDGNLVNNTDIQTTTVVSTIGDIYLPIIMKNSTDSTPAMLPDLLVTSIIATSNAATVTIRNDGSGPVVASNSFFVDLYVDPSIPPTAVNQTWNSGTGSTQGLVWLVAGGTALPLDPGEVLTLTLGDVYYLPYPAGSSVAFSPAPGTDIYAQVDSANDGVAYGAVLETHEASGGAYNNIMGPVLSMSGIAGEALPINNSPNQSIPIGDLPARP